jgi:hypothetical protein
VREWLQQEICLSEEELIAFSNFNYLDGQTLFAYEDVYELSKDLQIPIGLSRKIFLHRQPNDKLTRLLQYDMAKWSVSQVQAFIRQSVTVQSPDIEEICYNIQDKGIDGIVFLSYDVSKEMQLDLQTKDNLGVIFKRIITKRDCSMKSEETDSNSPDLSTDVKSPMDASRAGEKQVHNIKLTKNILVVKKTEGMSLIGRQEILLPYSKQKILSSFLMHFYFSNHCASDLTYNFVTLGFQMFPFHKE